MRLRGCRNIAINAVYTLLRITEVKCNMQVTVHTAEYVSISEGQGICPQGTIARLQTPELRGHISMNLMVLASVSGFH